MARNPSSEFLRRKAEPESQPLEIWDVHLGSTNSVDNNTLFFVVTNRNVRFYSFIDGSPRIYIGTGLGRSPISRHIDSKIDTVDISLENVDRTFSSIFVSGIDLRGKRLVIRKVFADYLAKAADPDGDNFVVMFDGILDAPTLNQTRFQAQARNNFFQSLAFTVPRRTYQGLCPWKFGSSGDCAGHRTQQQLFDTKTGQTVDTVPSQTHFIDLARSESGSGDYWAPGIIEMTGGTAGNIGQKRRIVQSTHSGDIFLESNFPYNLQVGDQYTIQRDCGHTLGKDCTDRFINNSEFGGFITIPENLVRRA
jgi:hypothetical protein